MNTQNNNTINNNEEGEDFIQIKDLFVLFISKWKWFAFSIIVCLAGGYFYVKTTQPTYQLSATIQIKDESKGNSAMNEMSSFSSLGLFQSNQNVRNEMHSLSSSSILSNVIRNLDLDISYATASFPSRVLYGSNLPIKINQVDSKSQENTFRFNIDFLKNGKVRLSNFVGSVAGESVEYEDELVVSLNQAVETPVGGIEIVPNEAYAAKSADLSNNESISISRTTMYTAISNYRKKLSVDLLDEKATSINLVMTDESYQRASDFLYNLIDVYNTNWIREKNTMTNSSSKFIGERLLVIESELSGVDENISEFKSNNLLPDIEAAARNYMEKVNVMESERIALHNQIYMAEFIQSYLKDDTQVNQLLPSNSGINSASVESQILEYNKLQLQRNNLVANSSEQNPLVQNLDTSLEAQHKSISLSIANLVETLKAQAAVLDSEMDKTTSDIAAAPSKAKTLLSVERQQMVKEGLYLFLLQKREENELSQTFTAYNTKVIDYPNGSLFPVAPRGAMIMALAMFLGLIIPAVIIFLIESLNTAVRGREDLNVLTVPFVGEIPSLDKKRRRRRFIYKTDDSLKIIVKEKSRNVINEAFRVVRTNLEFMTKTYSNSKVIMMVSVNPGSGKTFTVLNLSTSFAINNKKVLLIDLDMRKATLSNIVNSPSKGVADFLNSNGNYSDYIVNSGVHANLDIMPVGTMPPNPTELLLGDRLELLISSVRDTYDYVFIDCPPIDIIADSTIINKQVDMTLFVVRAEALDKCVLPYIQKLYNEHTLKNMGMILNGTRPQIGRRRTYGSYGYGSYGSYGAAYGSNVNDDDDE